MLIDRASHLRENGVEVLRSRPDARVIVFRGGHPLVVGDGEGLATLAISALSASRSSDACFLGLLDGAPHFLVNIAEAEYARVESAWPQPPRRSTFREAVPSLGSRDAALLSYAQGLLNWQSRSGFCPRCGHSASLERAGHVRACTNDDCRAEWFPRIDPVVIMLVTRGEELLLVRHRRARSSIFFSAVAGFVEHGETLEEAVARETREEVGLEVVSARYFGSQAWPLPTSLMVGFVADVDDGAPRIDEEELIEARWFTREDILSGDVRLSPPFSIARQMIDAWARQNP